ncbi:ABC transporter ATP-binding protein [[Clostridium] fimetarium]|uniref:ABC-2 type transport system ATP-binding protein n=1 Tax=[Clostridium] fimetarium TaxID=99656 RepID=A0A1I0R181_9FIRM|nr:ABC transporter ATP-binding protein [[Clostridium] fimetarium]SEW33701.1 ABC-2 type transport system ATP-binding protein [[Clostridium] fimetarium]
MIKTNNLKKDFDGFTALTDVSCTIPKGCIYGMVGSNGAGKSTFLRLITGVYRPDKGTILIDDQPVYENPEVKSKMTYVPDELYFLQGANMNRMADFYKAIYENFDNERYHFLTNAFGLNPKKSLGTFSKGMKRQAAIILALSCRPDYMFFDETFDGLDPVMRNLVKSLICKDVIESKVTCIITSHSLRELEDICDQLALLHKGGLVLESDIYNLKTSQFKIQVAFNYDYTEELFKGIDVHNIKKIGSVTNMIVKGSREATVKILEELNPIILEVLPLTLEEVFTYEMDALGYNFDDILK